MAKRSLQLKFGGKEFKQELVFGGSLHGKSQKTNPKCARCVSTKYPMHIVLRSSQARGQMSMRNPKHFASVEGITRYEAGRQGIKVIRYSNVGNHLHLLVKIGNRQTLKRFLRSLAGRLAMRLTGAKKGEALAQRFWDYRPFSRVVIGLRGFRAAMNYVELNAFEGLGVKRVKSRHESG